MQTESYKLSSGPSHKVFVRARFSIWSNGEHTGGVLSYYLPHRMCWEVMFSPASVIYVCEQLPGTNSSPIVTKHRQSYPRPQGTNEVIKFWKVKGQSRWGRYALYWVPF